MKVQVKAQLYRDQKRLWRVRSLDASIRDKGLPVPQALRGHFTDEHNGKSVIVEKVDGKSGYYSIYKTSGGFGKEDIYKITLK